MEKFILHIHIPKIYNPFVLSIFMKWTALLIMFILLIPISGTEIQNIKEGKEELMEKGCYIFPLESKIEVYGNGSIEIKPEWIEKGPDIKIEIPPYHIGVGIKDGKRVLFLNLYTEAEVKIEEGEEKIVKKDSYDFLIICPNEFIKPLQPLREHKESHGIKTIIVSLDDMYGGKYFETQGRDDAEKIKYFIKDAIEQWGIKYVLLVGDIKKLPTRYVMYAWRSGLKIHKEFLPTDLYYADIYRYENGKVVFSTWDTNNNGIYGERYNGIDNEEDIIDLYPDVYLGRLACENKRVVKHVVNKIIEYENNAYGKRWFKRLILVGGDTFPNWGVVEGEFMNELVAQLLNDFDAYRIWYSLGNLNTIEIQKALEMGAGFLYYSGHGFPYGWATHAINGSDEEWVGRYYTPYIAGLFNGKRLPIIFFDACLTAKLDFNSSDLRNDGIPIKFNATFPCFAWYFIRHPYGGAIATIGATRVAFTGVYEDGPHWGAGYLAYKFFESYKESDILGNVFVMAQEKYISKVWDEWTIQEFILLGDPTLKIGGYA